MSRRLLAAATLSILAIAGCTRAGDRSLPATSGLAGEPTETTHVDTMTAEPAPRSERTWPALATVERMDSLPSFDAYPARARYEGAPATPRLGSAEYGPTYRTKIREGAREGPNFAGAYTVVYWGCGSGCQIVAVVDARDGRLSRQTLHTMNLVAYERGSELLIADPVDRANPPPRDCVSCGTPSAYRWDGERFVPVGPGPHPHLEGDRPW